MRKKVLQNSCQSQSSDKLTYTYHLLIITAISEQCFLIIWEHHSIVSLWFTPEIPRPFFQHWTIVNRFLSPCDLDYMFNAIVSTCRILRFQRFLSVDIDSILHLYKSKDSAANLNSSYPQTHSCDQWKQLTEKLVRLANCLKPISNCRKPLNGNRRQFAPKQTWWS